MNTRLKYLRKNVLNITLKEFGEKISLSPSAIGDIESGRRVLQERHIKLISQTFNVNKEWLRNGLEPIFKEENYLSNDIISELFALYKELPEEFKIKFEKIIVKRLENTVNKELQAEVKKLNKQLDLFKTQFKEINK